MTNARDPTALLRHATLAGDRRLVELLAHARSGPTAEPLALAERAYGTLVVRLSLGDRGNYDHP